MIQLIVPFYKNPRLATAIGGNLSELAAEVKEVKAEILFINDSPDDDSLKTELQKQTEQLKDLGLSVTLLVNEKNLGFVKSCNKGMKIAIEKKAHALLLNSDVLMAAGCLREMRRVLELDTMFGFVCPRSNNASIASLPFENRNLKRSYQESFDNFKILSPYLDDWQTSPVAVGFCYLIRDVVLLELGVFDEKYSPGYNEENDLCFRANRVGFSSVIANKAFAYHESSSSFGTEQYSLYDGRNRTLLIERYGEFDRAVGEYLESANFKFEQLLFNLLLRHEGKYSVALDFTHFKTAHNGTYEFGIEVLNSLLHSDQRDFTLSIIGDGAGLDFHKIAERFPSLEIVSPQSSKTFDVVIKPAQVFAESDFVLLAEKGLHSFVFMLDTIALDSAYIRADSTRHIWELLPEIVDGILFISDFSKDQYNRRFPRAAEQCAQMACQLSVSASDYQSKNLTDSESMIEPDELTNNPITKEFFFVIGNHYEHKFLLPTIEALAKEFPEFLFVGLSGQSKENGNIRLIKSGSLSSKSIDMLYKQSKAVIFPSFYEGFGFPIPKGLAMESVVIARNSPLNQQISERWEGPGKLMIYDTTPDLLKIVRELTTEPAPSTNIWKKSDKTWDWAAFAEQLISFIRSVAQSDREFKKARQRLKIGCHLKLLQQQKDEIERARVAYGDELHARNLAFLDAEKRIETLERKLNEVVNSKSFRLGSSLLDGIAVVPGLKKFRHKELRQKH